MHDEQINAQNTFLKEKNKLVVRMDHIVLPINRMDMYLFHFFFFLTPCIPALLSYLPWGLMLVLEIFFKEHHANWFMLICCKDFVLEVSPRLSLVEWYLYERAIFGSLQSLYANLLHLCHFLIFYRPSRISLLYVPPVIGNPSIGDTIWPCIIAYLDVF